MLHSAKFVSLACCLCSSIGFAQEQPKSVVPVESKGRMMALVVGNKDYPDHPLTNPLNDADDMRKALEDIGFNVDVLKNASREEFGTKIDSFTQSLQEGDIVFFYYSGHGIAVQNQNYLIPVDFNGTTEASVRYRSVSADEIQRAIEDRKPRVAILVLDACRDNPFLRSKGLGGGGLAPMREAKGTLIAFAAGPGEAAIDNSKERNSLYTKYLLQGLAQPGLSVRDLFDRVAEQVHDASGQKILPSVNETLIGDLVFRPVDPKEQEAKRRFEDIRNTKDPGLLEGFIRDFPNTPEAAEAAKIENQLLDERQRTSRKADDDFWNRVKDSNSTATVDLYLSQFPSGAHVAEATELRRVITERRNDEERRQNTQSFQFKDDTAWEIARASNSQSAIDVYLRDFPNGAHIAEAKRLRDTIVERDRDLALQQGAQLSRSNDDTAWNIARATNSQSGVEVYLRDFPNGAHLAEAKRLRDSIVERDRDLALQQGAQLSKTKDDAAWEMALNTRSRSGYEAYLQAFANGAHASEAAEALAKMPETPATLPSVPIDRKQPYRNPRDKSDYAWVPGGTFEAGCREDDSACGPDEPRRHKVTLPDEGFWMGQTEVTVKAFRLFVDDTKRKMPPPSDDNHKWEFTDHPMIKVSWQEAAQYCGWAGGRLPTGDEWERAARGGADSRYPWGDTIQPNQAKYIKSPLKTGVVTSPVKSFDPNGYGLFDVSGNVWEWTTDIGAKGFHQARGGSWYSAAKDLHVTSVRTFKSDEGINEVGFRCLLPKIP